MNIAPEAIERLGEAQAARDRAEIARISAAGKELADRFGAEKAPHRAGRDSAEVV